MQFHTPLLHKSPQQMIEGIGEHGIAAQLEGAMLPDHADAVGFHITGNDGAEGAAQIDGQLVRRQIAAEQQLRCAGPHPIRAVT